MSKEKVNPGEDCPFCLTATKPGSTVCASCGASRVFGPIGQAKHLVKLAQVCLVPVVIILFFCAMGAGMSGRSGLSICSLAFIGLCIYGVVSFEKKQSEYIWQRKE